MVLFAVCHPYTPALLAAKAGLLLRALIQYRPAYNSRREAVLTADDFLAELRKLGLEDRLLPASEQTGDAMDVDGEETGQDGADKLLTVSERNLILRRWSTVLQETLGTR